MSKQPILKHSKTDPDEYYTPDGLFKVVREARGWMIYMRRDDGSYMVEATAETLSVVRRLIGQNMDKPTS